MRHFIDRLTDRDTEERKRELERIRELFLKELDPGCNIISDYEIRRLYSRDLADIPTFLEKMLFRTTPFLVIRPRSSEDVKALVDIAKKEHIPLFPRGISSWGLGGSVPTVNGIVVDMSAMDRMEPPDLESGTIRVQGGARWGLIDEMLEGTGLALPVVPSSRFSTVGGWIATGGLGLHSLRRGHVIKWIEEIEVVTPGRGIQLLKAGDPDFDLFFGTEGQIGFITWVKIKLVPEEKKLYPHLVYFKNTDSAFEFSNKMLEAGIIPLHMKFRAAVLNTETINARRTVRADFPGLLEAMDSMLFCFTKAEENEEYEGWYKELPPDPDRSEAPVYVARWLWLERYSPMKIKILGPSLLASEVILPTCAAPEYMRRAYKLARHYKVTLLPEIHFASTDEGTRVLVMLMFNCDRRKIFQYYAYLSLVPLLTRLGVKLGGSPYGIGIWNVPFFGSAFKKAQTERILKGKRLHDPDGIVNPRKFLSIKSRFLNLPAKLFHPIFYNTGMDLLYLFSPVVGRMLRPLGIQLSKDTDILETAPFACTSCGNCIAVCPACRVTGDESKSPRAKLSLARRIMRGKQLTGQQAANLYYCIRCGKCEDVCQALLPLREVWDSLEEKIKSRYPCPDDEIKSFVESLGKNPEFLDMIKSEPY